jgi:hypothetical protein
VISGAYGLFPGDQLQYLAWIRSAGGHVLAADDYALRRGGHVFLHPMFLLSGLLWRAGTNIAASYLVWLPIAAASLFVSFRGYARAMLGSPSAGMAAAALALFFATPANPLVGWLGTSSPGLGVFAGELDPVGALYGYLPAAIAEALVPLFLLRVGRLLAGGVRRSSAAPLRSARPTASPRTVERK